MAALFSIKKKTKEARTQIICTFYAHGHTYRQDTIYIYIYNFSNKTEHIHKPYTQ